jgi:hypothetical protein
MELERPSPPLPRRRRLFLFPGFLMPPLSCCFGTGGKNDDKAYMGPGRITRSVPFLLLVVSGFPTLPPNNPASPSRPSVETCRPRSCFVLSHRRALFSGLSAQLLRWLATACFACMLCSAGGGGLHYHPDRQASLSSDTTAWCRQMPRSRSTQIGGSSTVRCAP